MWTQHGTELDRMIRQLVGVFKAQKQVSKTSSLQKYLYFIFIVYLWKKLIVFKSQLAAQTRCSIRSQPPGGGRLKAHHTSWRTTTKAKHLGQLGKSRPSLHKGGVCFLFCHMFLPTCMGTSTLERKFGLNKKEHDWVYELMFLEAH